MSDKRERALYSFWSGFGLPAYDETSVPDNAQFPYLTYETAISDFNSSIPLSMSLWYYSASWQGVTDKAHEILAELKDGGKFIKYEDGAMWMTLQSPTYQRMSDDASDMIRRIIINVMVEFVN